MLLAGGSGGLATAEIYDPVAGTFRSVGGMTIARRLHTATLLADGRVLVVGGYGEGDALASAEIFDPATGTFSATGSLRTARGFHTATLLPTGAVLVIGGYGWRAYPNVAPAELYDPIAGVFRAAGEYVGRGGCDFCAPSVLLHDGTVLFTGQMPSQLYDPASDSFSPNGVMAFELSAAAALTNGQVLFAGGEVLGRMANAELYDPATRTFVRTADMAVTTRLAFAHCPPERNGPGCRRRNRQLLGEYLRLRRKCRERRTVQPGGESVCRNRQHGDRP